KHESTIWRIPGAETNAGHCPVYLVAGRRPGVMQRFYVEVGECAEFSKTVTEADIAMFAAVSGDFDPIHMDDTYAARSRFGRRIAHGILSMALLSTVSAAISRRARERGAP